MSITEADDRLHHRDDNPYWNESAWFGFALPEHDLHGAIHFYHRPNMSYTATNIAFWDPSGREQRDCLYYHFDIAAMADHAQMYDFTADSGLQVECLEPLTQYRLRYRHRDECQFDLTFRAVMAPHDTGFPTGIEEYGKGHYEQAGRLTGGLTIAGETLAVDHWCDRDHSWGPRRVVDNPRGAFHWGIASKDNAFHVNAVTEYSPDADPIFGTQERVKSGFYLRDGQVGTIRSGGMRVERATDGTPTRVEFDAKDSLGRVLHATGRPTNELLMYWHSFPLFQWWSSMQWDFDGYTAAPGEIQDYFTTWQARKLFRTGAGSKNSH